MFTLTALFKMSNLQCFFCKRYMKSIISYYLHMKLHSNVHGFKMKCPQHRCLRQLTSVNKLKSHIIRWYRSHCKCVQLNDLTKLNRAWARYGFAPPPGDFITPVFWKPHIFLILILGASNRKS